MQILYAGKGDDNINPQKNEDFLMQSIESMYDLYLLMLSLIIEVQKKSEDYINKLQHKHLATFEEKNPNRKFVHNRILHLLKSNQLLVEAFEKRKINNWSLDDEYIDVIFSALLKSPVYKAYMESQSSSFDEDRDFIIEVFKSIIAPNDKLYDYLEDKNITWLDDLPVINTTIVKLLRKVRKNTPPQHFVFKLFKDPDDKRFAFDLMHKTASNLDFLTKEIESRATNWDKDRIAALDFVLLQMAICELREFSSIPVKVSINEYIEIAKEYSTPKSSVFINGILDKTVKEYSDKGTLNKVGRGLL
jgi:N utilization substance protein B